MLVGCAPVAALRWVNATVPAEVWACLGLPVSCYAVLAPELKCASFRTVVRDWRAGTDPVTFGPAGMDGQW